MNRCYLTSTFAPTVRKAARPSTKKLRGRLANVIAEFFEAEAPKIARQVAALRAKYAKAALTQEEKDAVDRILAGIDFYGWSVLVGDVEDIIADIVKDGAYSALAEVGVDVAAIRGVDGIVSADAIAYARDRAAEMVGMRRDELGNLVANPNAEWQITESTRDFMRADVESAVAEGWSNDTFAAKLADSYGFSKERSMMIARTETNRATNTGALNGYKASGVVDGKQWLTAEDDRVSEECQANGEAGPNGDGVLLDLDAEFPSGDVAPPVHPNCRCTIAPYIDWKHTEPADADLETTGA